MEQFASFIFFIPCVVCLIWLIIFSFRIKTTTQRQMMVLLALGVYYFLSYAFYIAPSTDFKVVAMLDMFNVPVALAFAGVNLLFVCTHHSRRLLDSRWHMFLYTPVLVIASVNFFLNYVIGLDNVAAFIDSFYKYGVIIDEYDIPVYRWYRTENTLVVNYTLLAYLLFSVGFCVFLTIKHGYRLGDVWRFFFKSHESTPIRVICFLEVTSMILLMPTAGLGIPFMRSHPGLVVVLTLLLSVSLFCLCYVEYMIDVSVFSLKSLSHVQFSMGEDVDPEEAEVEQEEMEEESFDEAQEQVSPTEQIRFAKALNEAFEKDQVYLDPNLSIQSLSNRLGTNRTTLSSAIAQAYGMNFRQLVGKYRIEKAKRYMLDNPEAKQETVAMECGFITAQAFNQKFKEMVGEAPRMWIVKHSTGKKTT